MNYEISDFRTDVIERSKSVPVLVDFWAEWCGPCRILGPVLERLAEKADGTWALAKLDTERFPDIAAQYGIRSIPNVKLFVDGKPVNEFVGALPEPMVVEWLKKAIPPKRNPAVDRARDILADLRYTEAAVLLEPVVRAEEHNLTARALLAKAVFFDNPGRALSLVEPIEATADVHDLAEAIRTFHRLSAEVSQDDFPDGPARDLYREAVRAVREQDFDGALDKFIGVIREDRYYHDDAARLACIAIFKFLGEEHPVSRNHRRSFNSALFS
jgi:putative thioredoxin